jgi:hypothetical protein
MTNGDSHVHTTAITLTHTEVNQKDRLTLLCSLLVQDSVPTFAADDDIAGTKHHFRAAICAVEKEAEQAK